ncbi:MAG: hypothetical protein ABR961_14380 [Thermoanaerobaculaceae bacterium]|jgi:hypothetical protein
MPNARTTFAEIRQEITDKGAALNDIHGARQAIRGHTSVPASGPLLAALAPGHRAFKLLAHGDSWFDYPLGTDLIDCLHSNHGHTIVNIAVAGSTLNDEAYGSVPREMWGLPLGPLQSDDPSRIAELVHRIGVEKPQGLLLSAGGNDVAGDEFFSFLNNAQSGLSAVNANVVEAVVSQTFLTAYEFMIEHALTAAKDAGITMPIFVHGYDYPWPDGRGVIAFLGWRVGPWFDPTFSAKNYPNSNPADLKRRHDILVPFIKAVNDMQVALEQKYLGSLFHVDLTGTLQTKDDWANELHPNNAGFAALAAKFDAALQSHIPLASPAGTKSPTQGPS